MLWTSWPKSYQQAIYTEISSKAESTNYNQQEQENEGTRPNIPRQGSHHWKTVDQLSKPLALVDRHHWQQMHGIESINSKQRKTEQRTSKKSGYKTSHEGTTPWWCRGRWNPLKSQLGINYEVGETGTGLPLLDLRKAQRWTVPEQWGHPSNWPSPRLWTRQINPSKRGESSNSSERGATDEPAKSPSLEASSQKPVRVSDKIHRTLTSCWNRGVDVVLAMRGVKKWSHDAQQQDWEEKLQGKESISL